MSRRSRGGKAARVAQALEAARTRTWAPPRRRVALPHPWLDEEGRRARAREKGGTS